MNASSPSAPGLVRPAPATPAASTSRSTGRRIDGHCRVLLRSCVARIAASPADRSPSFRAGRDLGLECRRHDAVAQPLEHPHLPMRRRDTRSRRRIAPRRSAARQSPRARTAQHCRLIQFRCRSSDGVVDARRERLAVAPHRRARRPASAASTQAAAASPASSFARARRSCAASC